MSRLASPASGTGRRLVVDAGAEPAPTGLGSEIREVALVNGCLNDVFTLDGREGSFTTVCPYSTASCLVKWALT